MTRTAIQRFSSNPILTPRDVLPSHPSLEVECVLNPGAFEYEGRTGLLLRVAERPPVEEEWISTAVLDPATGEPRCVRIRRDDPDLVWNDPRVFSWKGQGYLTTLSHLRLAWSEDGRRFSVDLCPTLAGCGTWETFGIEDCRVTCLAGLYCLTYTAVSPVGHGVGLITTRDWRTFERHGLILPPPNKDCAVFDRTIGGRYWALHRPSCVGLGGNDLWIASSPDLLHWGGHRCIARTRPSMWDSTRIGAGGPPILTEEGWLCIYHGADDRQRYALGLLLLHRDDPARVLARSVEPVMTPSADYERRGFMAEVVFSNGHVVQGGRITLYYGASDTVTCGGTLSLNGAFL